MISELVGDIILTYGNLEKTIDMVIGSYFEKILGFITANHLSQIVVSRVGKTKSKIEILEDLIKRTIMSEETRNNWTSLFKDLNELNKVRNLLAHNFYGVNDNKLIKIKRDNNDEILSIEMLEKYRDLLNDRYRQLFDLFVDVAGKSQTIWISKYPLLKFE